MGAVVKTRIIKIGNSHGIRIPKVLLDQVAFGSQVQLEVEKGRIIIGPSPIPRQGWDEQFRAMAEQGDDGLSGEGKVSLTKWDEEEWEW